jgi:hypothetical protein
MGEPNLLALYYHKVEFWRLKTWKDCGKVFELSVVLKTQIKLLLVGKCRPILIRSSLSLEFSDPYKVLLFPLINDIFLGCNIYFI